ncbi:MAG: glycosyl hydrolase family 88, partial [Duncaniella sp.]|nr:glycosyl hydrolase family 88 [Duncaniella sp.]
MKYSNLSGILLGFMAMTSAMTLDAQNTVSTTGYVVNPETNVTMRVTQEVSSRMRRTTSQGDPEARLDNSPGDAPARLALPLAESVMVRYPDYRNAY